MTLSPLLPADFLFGVATAGFQIEGGFNGPHEPGNNWAPWETQGRVEPSGSATRFLETYPEQLDRAQSIGLNSFRLSIEWARVEPSRGVIDDKAIATYRSILSAIRARNMEPVVTLHHFTHPAWLGPEPWREASNAAVLAAWMERCVETFGDLVTHWVTVNEPNILSINTWLTGLFPPGRIGDVSGCAETFDTLLTAHVIGFDAIKRIQPASVVTTNPYTLSLYELDQFATDLLLSRRNGIEDGEVVPYLLEKRRSHYKLWGSGGSGERGMIERFIRRITATQFSVAESLRGTRRALESSDLEGHLDVVAVDHYAPMAASHLVLPGRQTSGGRWWNPGRALWDDEPDPALFSVVLDEAASTGLPVWILENGMSNRVRRGRSFGRMDSLQRPDYLRDHLGAVVEAKARGVDVRGYWHWTLIDNYEWGSYEPRFGLYGMDRERGLVVNDVDSLGDDSATAYRILIESIRRGTWPEQPHLS
jgi:beta-glucosidase/6-phospho-beta-glucosidase/beta-galactosidase